MAKEGGGRRHNSLMDVSDLLVEAELSQIAQVVVAGDVHLS